MFPLVLGLEIQDRRSLGCLLHAVSIYPNPGRAPPGKKVFHTNCRLLQLNFILKFIYYWYLLGRLEPHRTFTASLAGDGRGNYKYNYYGVHGVASRPNYNLTTVNTASK